MKERAPDHTGAACVRTCCQSRLKSLKPLLFVTVGLCPVIGATDIFTSAGGFFEPDNGLVFPSTFLLGLRPT